MEVRSPYDGSVVGEVEEADERAVATAVATARAALDRGPLPQHHRAEILEAAARALAERVDELARTIAAEAAKPLRTAETEVRRAVSTFAYAAIEARTLTGDMVPLEGTDVGAGKLGFTLRVPVGVVGAITPFNFPLNLVAHKVAPAIAAGCPVVLKPASQTPLSALALRDLLVDGCGLPPEQLQVVVGPGSVVGEALVRDEGVAALTFTGSSEVGWALRAKAPRKRVGLELGNNAPVVIEPDADWATAAEKISVAGYSHAGQSCISTQRVYVHRSIADGFVEALAAAVAKLVVGDPLDPATDVSALISEGDCDRVASWIREAADGGAEVVVGGDVDGTLLQPAVVTGMKPDMRISREEVFGPVVGVAVYDDFDEALRLANDTRFGLQAAVWTADLGKALAAARQLRFGGVLVNEVPTFRADQMPYGGVGDSGNTREGPRYAVRELTEERLVLLQP